MRRRRGIDGIWYDTPRHVELIAKRWRWVPSPAMRKLGATAETLPDAPAFTRQNLDRANDLNGLWYQVRRERDGLNAVPRAPLNSIRWMLKEFEQSTDFYKSKSPRTKEAIDWAFRVIDASPLALHDVRSIQAHHCKQFFDTCFGDFGLNEALRATKWLRRVFSFARLIKGLIKHNPASRLELPRPPKRRVTYLPEEITSLIRQAFRVTPKRWSLAVTMSIAYDSSQRLSDILALKREQFDGEGIDWTQGKTDNEVWTPLSRRTLRLLAKMPPGDGVHLIVNENTGKPWSRFSYWRVFNKIRKGVTLSRRKHMHDFRRTVGSEISAGGGRVEPLLGLVPGSNAAANYQVPSKEAARDAQARRRPVRQPLVGRQRGDTTRTIQAQKSKAHPPKV